MRQPRTSDFDPKPQERALKSSMAEFPAIEGPQQNVSASVHQLTEPDRVGRVDLVGRKDQIDQGVPVASPKKRRMKPRHSFDVYADQVEVLQQLALEDRMRGGPGSMSAMAREALDDYIAKVRSNGLTRTPSGTGN